MPTQYGLSNRQQARHREYRAALMRSGEMLGWCADHKIVMQQKNDYQHWVFQHGSSRCEWWPSSGCVMFDSRHGHTLHRRDCDGIKKLLCERWPLTTETDKAAARPGERNRENP